MRRVLFLGGVAASLALATAAASCGSLLGIEQGIARDEAGATLEAGADGCVPELTVCAGKCGLVPDRCGGPAIDCGRLCPSITHCDDATHTCTCDRSPTFCDLRCGDVTDNCGQTVTCDPLGCPMDKPCQLDKHQCGDCASPDPRVTCAQAGKNCGVVKDICERDQSCGAGGTSDCPLGADCIDGKCCTPQYPCTGSNCGTFSDGCQRTVTCNCTNSVNSCNGGVCQPVACTPDCTNTACGQPSNCPGVLCNAQKFGCPAESCCQGEVCAEVNGFLSGYQCSATCTPGGQPCDSAQGAPNGCCWPTHCVAAAGTSGPTPDPDAGTPDGAVTYVCK